MTALHAKQRFELSIAGRVIDPDCEASVSIAYRTQTGEAVYRKYWTAFIRSISFRFVSFRFDCRLPDRCRRIFRLSNRC